MLRGYDTHSNTEEIEATENAAEECSVPIRKRDPGKHGMTLYPLGTAPAIKKATATNQKSKPAVNLATRIWLKPVTPPFISIIVLSQQSESSFGTGDPPNFRYMEHHVENLRRVDERYRGWIDLWALPDT